MQYIVELFSSSNFLSYILSILQCSFRMENLTKHIFFTFNLRYDFTTKVHRTGRFKSKTSGSMNFHPEWQLWKDGQVWKDLKIKLILFMVLVVLNIQDDWFLPKKSKFSVIHSQKSLAPKCFRFHITVKKLSFDKIGFCFDWHFCLD